eukprot:CAMPEP_0177682598 /NCGR_PEP_ID=MMETSP0447-20121125/31341_1 /TAXON_ID=0 /ORGANISM="Stygamoeba regulata, Strain BSH-02190019" /LENGTH=259 /DNA_ID=CAMNT_0019192105 /DNA_START=149 /DNA_END=929 /DNA_ORIENTATION=-
MAAGPTNGVVTSSSTQSIQNRRRNRGPTVRDILKDPLLLPVFRDFLEATLCVENLLFFQEVERFNQLITDQERQTKFAEICSMFLAHESEMELDFPDELRAIRVEEDVFLMLQAEAYGTLTRDSLPRFLASPEYDDFLANPPDSPRVACQRRKLERFFGEQLVGSLQRNELLDKVLKRNRRTVQRLSRKSSLGRFGWAKSRNTLSKRDTSSSVLVSEKAGASSLNPRTPTTPLLRGCDTRNSDPTLNSSSSSPFSDQRC